MSQNTQAAAATKSKFSVRDICYAGLFAAVIAVMAQLSIPMPLGVPMTMQTFAITLAAVVLGSKLSAIATLVYLALGAVGVPVLANFQGGPSAIFGKTGGYILGYILCALIVGALSRKFAFNFKTLCLSMVLGVAVCYAFGTIWFMAVTGLNLATSMSYCVIPFLPGDAVKILLAAFLALRLLEVGVHFPDVQLHLLQRFGYFFHLQLGRCEDNDAFGRLLGEKTADDS